jgi:hypothetical protein
LAASIDVVSSLITSCMLMGCPYLESNGNSLALRSAAILTSKRLKAGKIA